MARVLRLGLTGGIGGAGSTPFWSEAPGGRLTVVIRDVEEISRGSEMSDLLTERLRFPGTRPWVWKPCVVGVFAADVAGEGCGKDGVELPEKVAGDGLGESPVSLASAYWVGCSFCASG